MNEDALAESNHWLAVKCNQLEAKVRQLETENETLRKNADDMMTFDTLGDKKMWIVEYWSVVVRLWITCGTFRMDQFQNAAKCLEGTAKDHRICRMRSENRDDIPE